MKLLAQNQAMKTAEIMDGLLDTDMLERQRHAVINREIRLVSMMKNDKMHESENCKV